MTFCRAFEDTDSEKMGNLMSIFFPKAAAPAPLEQVATQGGEPNVVRLFTFVNFHPRFFVSSLPS